MSNYDKGGEVPDGFRTAEREGEEILLPAHLLRQNADYLRRLDAEGGMSNRTRDAERAIAAILAQLEIETASLVRHIEIIDVDTTSIESPRQEIQRRVSISLDPQPGTSWA